MPYNPVPPWWWRTYLMDNGNLTPRDLEFLKTSPSFTWYHTTDWRLEILPPRSYADISAFVLHCPGEAVCGGLTYAELIKEGRGCHGCDVPVPPEVQVLFALLISR